MAGLRYLDATVMMSHSCFQMQLLINKYKMLSDVKILSLLQLNGR